MTGRFITLEGTEGVGKTSNLSFIADYLRNHQVNLITSREPGGTEYAEKIRALLLAHQDEMVHSDTELLLMFAARAQHLQQKILPALQAGTWVLSDRFTDATFAYQGGGRGIDRDRIRTLETWVQGEVRPDLTILLDAPVEVGMTRASKRGELDRFEIEKAAFFERVRAAYLQRVEEHPERYLVVDAAQPLELVQRQIKEKLDQWLGR